MKFCEFCNYMLYPQVISENEADLENGKVNLYYQCNFCGFRKLHDSDRDGAFVISSSSLQASNADLIQSGVVNEFTKFNPTYARTNKIPCVNHECISNTEPDERQRLQIREVIPYCANPISLKYLFVCCLCDHVWSMDK